MLISSCDLVYNQWVNRVQSPDHLGDVRWEMIYSVCEQISHRIVVWASHAHFIL